MMKHRSPSRWLNTVFAAVLFFSALTGFAQMPIFKRYYIADLPGLGWLAQFHITYALHYISASVLLGIIVFRVIDYGLVQRRRLHLTLSGCIRGTLLLLILISGILLVFRNLPGYRFSPEMVIALDFSHLCLVTVFLAASLVSRLLKKPWSVGTMPEGDG